ncbi:type II 3-dehydroquinate dehydratase [Paraglaciecola polaris]|uniref:3-dehydroquinate dehydratase n=1 Tax=Paraglaciecola polaris LMG 21857 TaxID=1129793 RepID=K6YJM6_9ALTE|nr:type II 3-dehydroquinate dehydratase [Paraglaciecola polaris]GAC32929.1 3-dehydroquinate dehydratase [Paraglaciecola polaris LMG 21857]
MKDNYHINEDSGLFLKVLLINGPNLNMLGKREPEVYGSRSLQDIVETLQVRADELNIAMSHVQSNAEHALIDAIHNAYQKVDFIIINPGAFTHTSIALRDALLSVSIPFIEVHLSNVHAREPFRHHSYLSDVALGVICGMGEQGYGFALSAAQQHLSKKTN